MDKIIAKVEKTIEKYELFARGDRILIALSGGPDSVALFHLLYLLAEKYELNLAAAHVNHKIRPEAARDRLFCRNLCRAYSSRFHSIEVDIKARAKRLKIGVEEGGRVYRYDYFQRLCKKYGYAKIATGHNADDSAETIILNLVRGADIGGLTGIPSRRGLIIRPLIELSKSEILEFLKNNGLSYRIDKSNRGIEYKRNIVRNQVLPVLERINKQATRHIAKTGKSLSDSFNMIQTMLDRYYRDCLIKESNTQITLDLEKLPVYYKSLKSWILLRAYQAMTGEFNRPDSTKIERAVNLSRKGAVTFLGNGIYAANHAGNLILSRPPQQIKRINLVKGKMNKLPESVLSIRATILDKFDFKEIFSNNDESVAYLNDAKIGRLEVRNFKPGDRFKPLGMAGTKKVTDYLNEKGVSRLDKSSVPIITADSRIAWVAGYGISDNFKVTTDTARVLKLQVVGNINSDENINTGS